MIYSTCVGAFFSWLWQPTNKKKSRHPELYLLIQLQPPASSHRSSCSSAVGFPTPLCSDGVGKQTDTPRLSFFTPLHDCNRAVFMVVNTINFGAKHSLSPINNMCVVHIFLFARGFNSYSWIIGEHLSLLLCFSISNTLCTKDLRTYFCQRL